ncbi:hypothetical protein EDD17DRAFT_855067 [Pisolithus thermaeus]|nr:hypothetical protein EDD17DRAFT_855067 [Pisolithus thermaeus]
MARRRSRKLPLFASRNPPGSASSSVPSKGPFQAPTCDVASIAGTSGNVSQGVFARARHFFHRSSQGSVKGTARGEQEQGKEVQVLVIQDTQGPTDNPETGGVLAVPDSNVDTTVGPIGDAGKDAADPNSGANTTPILVPAPIGSELDTAQEALERMTTIPRVGQTAIDFVTQADSAVANILTFNNTYLQPLKVFSSVVNTVAQVHPYAQIALGILTAAAQSLINQANLDRDVSDLFGTVRAVYEFLLEDDTIQNINGMKATLGKIARATSDAARFIKNYSETTSFWKRLGKNIMDIQSETRSRMDSYTKTLNDLMQQYRDRAVRDIQANVHQIVEDLNLAHGKLDAMHGDVGVIRGDLDFVHGDLSLEGMVYAGGAGVNKTKKCLDGTRTEILTEIVSWIQNNDENVPRILWLHGQAGRGKSAIAHTIVLWLKDAGGLGSCFCFALDRQAKRREEKIFATIARDLADYDPASRRALADVLAKDHSLKTTSDVTLQWEKLILEPLWQVSSTMIGNMVVVDDAQDESGLEGLRKFILSVLKSGARDLPRNIRILLTSRPLPDIQLELSGAPHVKAICLDDVSKQLTERDIRLYVLNQL